MFDLYRRMGYINVWQKNISYHTLMLWEKDEIFNFAISELWKNCLWWTSFVQFKLDFIICFEGFQDSNSGKHVLLSQAIRITFLPQPASEGWYMLIYDRLVGAQPPILLLICLSSSRENGHPLHICSSSSAAQYMFHRALLKPSKENDSPKWC